MSFLWDNGEQRLAYVRRALPLVCVLTGQLLSIMPTVDDERYSCCDSDTLRYILTFMAISAVAAYRVPRLKEALTGIEREQNFCQRVMRKPRATSQSKSKLVIL